MKKNIYPIKYQIETGEFTVAELEKGNFGGTDILMLTSVIYFPDGSSSTLFFGYDGIRNENKLAANEIFKIWTLLAKEISEDERLDEGRRKFCEHVFETIRQQVLQFRYETH